MIRKDSLIRVLDFFIIALITTIIVAVILPVYRNIKDEYDARIVLEESKLIKLSCYTHSLEAYAHGETIFDGSQESNIEKSVYQDIIKFVKTDADFYVLKVNGDGISIDKMVFVFDNFMVTVNNDKWKVDKVKSII